MGKYTQDAQQLLRLIGGKENIAAVSHCVTRMRFVLNDPSKADEEAIEAISNGEFFFSMSEEDEVIVEYDINSLHNFTTERTSDYSKNRVIRVYDSFADDLKLTFPPNKFDNDEDGWLVMEGLGRALLQSYAKQGAITNVDAENDFYVDQSKSIGDETFFNVGLQAVDSAEKLYFSVSTR